MDIENWSNLKTAEFLREIAARCLDWDDGTIKVTPLFLEKIADKLERSGW